MASKLTMSMYSDKQKKNTFQPYIDAGNAAKAASAPQSMSLSVNKHSSYQTGNNALKNAYSANKNNSISMQSQSATNNQPSATNGQTALQKAYQTNSTSGSGYYSSERQNALNQAETSYNKLLNYLPEYQELMGMRGLGISNQALMNAYGKYQQSVSDINSQYDALEKEYALQQDALAKEELETQMARATYARDDLQAYITSAGDNFTQEGYNRFKQGLLEAGYTQQEIDAAEKMLSQSELNKIEQSLREETDPVYSGKKPLRININDADNKQFIGELSFENAVEIPADEQAVISKEANRRGIKAIDGTAYNILNSVVFYYNGRWYQIALDNVEFA